MTVLDVVVAGIDPHADTIHVAVITTTGNPVTDAEFPTTPDGYQRAVTFLRGAGAVQRAGVEGAAGYGAGVSRALRAAGVEVVEVARPSRADRRRAGKSDQLDAYHAARSVLAGRASPVKDPTIDGLRALHLARRSGVKARTATMNQIVSLLVMAPDPVREKFRRQKGERLVTAIIQARTGADQSAAHTLTAVKMLAERHRHLTGQIDQLTKQIDPLVTAAHPELRAAHGVGPDTAAQLLITAGNNPDRLTSEASFAALCGVAPVPASSGKTSRHRLSRGGDRAANNALYRIALVRMSSDPRTKAYVERQTERGRNKPEIIRMLKRAIARDIYRLLTQPVATPDYADLRPARQARNITLTAVAQHFAVWPTTISRLERGHQRNDALAHQYRDWLLTA